MRVLGVGETCDLADMYLSLQREGHEVRVAVSEPLAHGTLLGLCPRTDNWRAELEWVRAAGGEGLILFEAVSEGLGVLQDSLRAEGFNVIGGSAFGDRLENDRRFGQQVLADLGLTVTPGWPFGSADEAITFIAANPGRYVLKHSGADHASADTYVGRLPDGRDVAAVLAGRRSDANLDLLLTPVVEGVEMGVGAYFDGHRFLRPACLDWEHKRFFAGDMGELTGEMGTVATYQRSDRFFEATLGRLAPLLEAHGHVGYVNLNTIVNEEGIWPLEFTCRFGYPGFAVLAPLQGWTWGELFGAMVRGDALAMPTSPGYCLGVVLTTPPFPYSRKQVTEQVGLPVLVEGGLDPRHHHLGEVGLDADGAFVTSGLYGWTMVATGEGATVRAAQTAAYNHAARVFSPNLRYRLDIGDRLIASDLARVEALGLLS